MTEEYRKKKILIVDNEEDQLENFLVFINRAFPEKYDLIAIDSADRAIDKIKSGLEYDLAIIDSSMYTKTLGAHGGELLARTSKKANPKTKIIMVSGWPVNYRGNPDVDILLSKFEYWYSLDRCIEKYLENSEE